MITVCFQEERSGYIELDMEYESVGSSAGKKRITGVEGSPVHFAGSDSLLSDEDNNRQPDLIMFPTMAG